jgi:SAM-dependent methyltransferase
MSSRFLSRGAENYDSYMGRWSRRLAPLFLDFAELAPGEHVIEVGCGTGSLSFAVPEHAAVARLEAIDYDAGFVAAARDRNSDPRIRIARGDACRLDFCDEEFDRALSMLVLHYVSDPELAVAEMRGVAAAAVWDTFGGMPTVRLFWDSAAAVEPSASDRRSTALLRPMTQPGELRQAFARAGFIDIVERALVIRMEFASFDDYWIPTVTGQGMHAEFMTGLPAPTRERIESRVRAGYLCNRPDGPRSFACLAWAVRGVVPREHGLCRFYGAMGAHPIGLGLQQLEPSETSDASIQR